jgi:hypothetical protein
MSRTNLHSISFTNFLSNHTDHCLLCCRNILDCFTLSNRCHRLMRTHLTRRELLSIHHLLRLAEWCNSPARVAITGISVLFAAVESC